MADKVPQTGLAVAVQDEASEPIGDIEKAYTDFEKSMKGFMKTLSKAMKSQSDGMTEAGDAAEEASEKQEEHTGRLYEAKEALKDNALGLDRLGLSWKGVLKALTAVSIGAALVGVVAFFKKAMDAAVKFRQEIALLNEKFEMTARDTMVVSSAILSLTNRAGKSREEVTGLVGALLELGQTPAAAKAAGTSFRRLAKDTLDFSAATGVGMEQSAALTDQLLRINKVPANNIRNIGYSIKSIADNTRLSSDELVSFNKSLEPLFAFMGDQSGEAKTAFTQNMLGIAGALSDVGVDANKVVGSFGDMLDRTSSTGIQALGNLSIFTKRQGEELREMIKNDPTQVIEDIAKATSNYSDDQLMHAAHGLESLGLGFAELKRLQAEYGAESKKSFKDRVNEINALAAKDEALAQAAAKRQEPLNRAMQKLSAIWDSFMVTVGAEILNKLVYPLVQTAMPVIENLVNYLTNLDWGAVFSGVMSTIKGVIDAFKLIKNVVSGVFNFVGEAIALGISTYVDWYRTIFALLTGDFGKAKQYFYGMIENIVVFVKDKFKSMMGFFSKIGKGIGAVFAYIRGDDDAFKKAFAEEESSEESMAPQVATSEERKPGKQSTVSSARKKDKVHPGSVFAGPSALNVPDTMTTNDSAAQHLLRENNSLQKQILNELKGKGFAPGGAKFTKTMRMAGL